jgi:hypothetical protein
MIYKKTVARFEETIAIEAADGLQSWLCGQPKAKLDFSACTHLHAAVLQVLMAQAFAVSAWPRDERLKVWLTAALQR